MGNGHTMETSRIIGRKQLKLLVINDDALSRELLLEHMEMAKHEFEIEYRFAESDDEASLCMRDWSPSVVLVDAYSAVVDCFTFIDQWKEGSSSIVVTSDEPSQAIAASALSRGASAYVARGEGPEEIEFLLQQIAALAPLVRLHH